MRSGHAKGNNEKEYRTAAESMTKEIRKGGGREDGRERDSNAFRLEFPLERRTIVDPGRGQG